MKLINLPVQFFLRFLRRRESRYEQIIKKTINIVLVIFFIIYYEISLKETSRLLPLSFLQKPQTFVFSLWSLMSFWRASTCL